MSQTVLFVAYADGILDNVFRFPNSWGSGAMIWTALCKKYLKPDPTQPHMMEFFPSPMVDWPRIWKYDKDGGAMVSWERNTLITTYDRTIVERKDMLAVAASLDLFHSEYVDQCPVSTLAAQAAAIRFAYEKGAVAIAWQQTTVSDAWMVTQDEDENPVYYNVLTQTNHNTYEIEPLS